eukprot:457648_1
MLVHIRGVLTWLRSLSLHSLFWHPCTQPVTIHMAHLLEDNEGDMRHAPSKKIKCRVHIVIYDINTKQITSAGTILVPIRDNLQFSQLIEAARHRISKSKKYDEYRLNYTPESLEIYIREKTDNSLTIEDWSEVMRDDLISELFVVATDVVVFKFTPESVAIPGANKDTIMCRIFLRYAKQQQEDEKKQEHEVMGNDLPVKINKNENTFLELLSILKPMVDTKYHASFMSDHLRVYISPPDEAIVEQITNWAEMDIGDELEFVEDEIVIIMLELQDLNDANVEMPANINDALMPAMDTYLTMKHNSITDQRAAISIKVRYWNKRNEICEVQSTFPRDITVRDFKNQISRASGLAYRSDSTPSLQSTPTHPCICEKILNQPVENGKVNFFYRLYGASKKSDLIHFKLEIDFDKTIEELCTILSKTLSLNLKNMRVFAGTREVTFIRNAKLSDIDFTENSSNVFYCCNDETAHAHHIAVEFEQYNLGFKNNNETFDDITAIKSPNMKKSAKVTVPVRSSASILLIKSMIQSKIKIPIAQQLIFYQAPNGDMEHVGNDYCLRDIALTEKLSLVVANWNDPIHVAFDLFNHSHQLLDHGSLPLFEVFNFHQNEDILFVSPRYIFHEEAFLASFGKDDAKIYNHDVMDGSMKSMLRLSSAWMPYIAQTRRGMSAFLSCLFVLSRSAKVKENKDAFLGHLRELSPTFSPFVVSMNILFTDNVNQMTAAHKSALSSGCYKLFRQMMPSASVSNDKVFEYSHYMFWYLLRFISEKFSKTEEFKEESLICPLSSGFLVDPVTIPNDGEIYSYRSVKDRLKGGKAFDVNNEKFSSLSDKDICMEYDTHLLLKIYPKCKGVEVWRWQDLTKKSRKAIDEFDVKQDDDDHKNDTGVNPIQQKMALTWRQITKYIYDTSTETCSQCQKEHADACIQCKKVNERKHLSECMTMKSVQEYEKGAASLCWDDKGNKCVIATATPNEGTESRVA